MDKQDIIQKQRPTSEITNDTVSSDRLPSWSELSRRADAKNLTRNTVILSTISFGLSFLIPLGAFATVFLITIVGSILGLGGAKSGMLAGGIVSGVSALIGSILFSIVTLGLLTVFPATIIGIVIGFVGGTIGKWIKNKLK